MQMRIGISGWTYDGWRSTFYPADLPRRRELEYASDHLNSIEINGSFYSLQKPTSYQSWYDQTPDDFMFAVKAGRYITHVRRLKEVAQPLANFFASGVLCLKEKLGPMLWQFPPNMRYDHERFAAFIAMLPHTTRAAAKLARGHDAWMKDRVWTRPGGDRPIRHAFEIRHDSFFNDAYIRLLREHNIAWVMSDADGHWPFAEEVTADFIYARLHGSAELYASGYDEANLQRWASRLRAWQAGRHPPRPQRAAALPLLKHKQRDAFIYFDNDAKVEAPFNAMRLAQIMSRQRSRRAG